MSSLALLGALGTTLSTVAMTPHVLHAVRTRRPAGSTFAWALGGTTASVWMLYGLLNGDFLVAAPGLVTVPSNFVLAVWCSRMRVVGDVSDVTAADDHDMSMVVVPDWEPVGGFRGGDTLEMPRIVA